MQRSLGASRRAARLIHGRDPECSELLSDSFRKHVSAAKAFDKWLIATSCSKPLWVAHAHARATRKAFARWKLQRDGVQLTAAQLAQRSNLKAMVLYSWMLCWKNAASRARANRAARELVRAEASASGARPSASRRRRARKKARPRVQVATAEDVYELAGLVLTEECSDEVAEQCSGEVAEVAEESVTTESTCVVCLEPSADWALVPCGHKILCERCSTLFERPGSSCPMCRKPVRETCRIYG